MNPPPFSSPSERLSTFFEQQSEHRAYTDSEIQQISRLLSHVQESWGRCPRTYIVLRNIGGLALLNPLIELGFSDYWFPVEPRSLPQNLSPSLRAAFVKAQRMVLTKSIDLEKGERGQHGHFRKDEPLPFEIKGRLGSGAFAQVDRIVSLISYREYALKRSRRRLVFGNDSRDAFKRFKAEVEIIKHLTHRHMIEFIGSYTDPSYLGIIMSPIADTDLAKYMKSIAESVSTGNSLAEDLTNLRSYFGCLANALQYLHEQSIRHKDIKPQNILIKGGNVLFTDFGLSRNFQDATGSTSSGMTYMTQRYSAPEVVAYDARNTSADIWSLGCVYLEMTLILKGLTLGYMDNFFDRSGSRDPYVNCNPEATAMLIAELAITGSPLDSEPLGWIKTMLIRDRHLRHTAAQVFTCITDQQNHRQRMNTTFCGICCLGTDESDSDDSLYEECNTDSNGMGSSFSLLRSHSAREAVPPHKPQGLIQGAEDEASGAMLNESKPRTPLPHNDPSSITLDESKSTTPPLHTVSSSMVPNEAQPPLTPRQFVRSSANVPSDHTSLDLSISAPTLASREAEKVNVFALESELAALGILKDKVASRLMDHDATMPQLSWDDIHISPEKAMRKIKRSDDQRAVIVEELTEIKRQEHEVGFKLHKAYRNMDRNGPTSEGIWVRRVNGTESATSSPATNEEVAPTTTVTSPVVIESSASSTKTPRACQL